MIVCIFLYLANIDILCVKVLKPLPFHTHYTNKQMLTIITYCKQHLIITVLVINKYCNVADKSCTLHQRSHNFHTDNVTFAYDHTSVYSAYTSVILQVFKYLLLKMVFHYTAVVT